jgi:ABC-type polysaccharide/polyol phosphate transport system ATPase subunit
MSDIAIKVENLSKKYIIGHGQSGSLRETLSNAWQGAIGRQRTDEEEFWALRDINFEIKQGEAVGIIGRNGAGKSTLLKLLSKITYPTSGKITMNGRVSSLLEVGTGFHPELTGRENIYLNGTILGMSRKEVKSKFDEIVAFSGVEKFLDTPVKRYSSGMYVRLAFAVAAHLEPEILIIDEVLAVGDAEFQKKCLGKMDEMAKGGRTVLFVSHNMSAISTLTNKAVLLNSGKIEFYGDTSNSIRMYQQVNHTNSTYSSHQESLPKKPRIKNINIITTYPSGLHQHGEALKIDFDIFNPFGVKNAAISFQIINEMNIPCVHLWYYGTEHTFLEEPGNHKLECVIPTLKLYQGHYSLSVFFANFSGEVYDKLINICSFEVSMINKKRDYPWQKDSCIYMEDSYWIKT